MKLYLKTLSLLHVGSGNQLETLDYIVDETTFYKLGNHTFTSFLETNHLIGKYQEHAKKIYEELSHEKDNKKQNEKRNELSLYSFCKKLNQWNQLKKFLEEDDKTQKIKLKHLKAIDFKGNKVREHIRNGLQHPYIPGSSIKGAIRTALLYHWLNHHANENEIFKLFEEDLKDKQKNNKKNNKNFANNIECFAFYCRKEGQKDYDEKLDLMKLLHISDGKILRKNPIDSLTIAKPYLFLLTAEKQKQAIIMEAIQENVFIELDISINLQFLLSIKSLIKSDSITIDGKKEWIGIQSKCQQLFGIKIEDLTPENLHSKEKEVIQFIVDKVKDFSEKQLNKHCQWKNKINSNPKPKNKQQITFKKEEVNFDYLPLESNIMHLGFGTGFIGTTEILYILENENLKEKFLEIMKVLKIGKKPGFNKDKNGKENEYNPSLEDLENAFPKSRLMYEEEINKKNSIKPLGWVQIMYELEYENSKELHLTQENVDNKENKIYEPNYFKEKLKPGVVLEGQYIGKDVKNPKTKKFKLFIQEPGKEQECLLTYNSDLEEGQYVKLTVNNVDKSGKVLSIGFKSMIK